MVDDDLCPALVFGNLSVYFDSAALKLPHIPDIFQISRKNDRSKWAGRGIGTKTQNRNPTFQLIDVIDFSAYAADFANMLTCLGVINALSRANWHCCNDDDHGKQEMHMPMLGSSGAYAVFHPKNS